MSYQFVLIVVESDTEKSHYMYINVAYHGKAYNMHYVKKAYQMRSILQPSYVDFKSQIIIIFFLFSFTSLSRLFQLI